MVAGGAGGYLVAMTSIELSLALAGLDVAVPGADAGEVLRAQVGLTRRLGLRWVQLNAAAPGLRPRELGRSARRDLASVLRRDGVMPSGVDLWVPPEHFAAAAHQDRAVTAATEAIDFAGEVCRAARGEGGAGGSGGAAAAAVVSLLLPRDGPGESAMLAVRRLLAERAERAGVVLADHTWSREPAVPPPGTFEGPLRPGLDPAGVFMAGGDAVVAAAAMGASLASARLSDVSSAGRRGAGPAVPGGGGGRLDVAAYAVTLTVAGYAGPVVLDLRQVPDQAEAATRAVAAWAAVAGGGGTPAVGGGAFKLRG